MQVVNEKGGKLVGAGRPCLDPYLFTTIDQIRHPSKT